MRIAVRTHTRGVAMQFVHRMHAELTTRSIRRCTGIYIVGVCIGVYIGVSSLHRIARVLHKRTCAHAYTLTHTHAPQQCMYVRVTSCIGAGVGMRMGACAVRGFQSRCSGPYACPRAYMCVDGWMYAYGNAYAHHSHIAYAHERLYAYVGTRTRVHHTFVYKGKL
jgi:hypothetical protein